MNKQNLISILKKGTSNEVTIEGKDFTATVVGEEVVLVPLTTKTEEDED